MIKYGMLDDYLEKIADSEGKTLVQLDTSDSDRNAVLSVQDACDINKLVQLISPSDAVTIEDESNAEYIEGNLKNFSLADDPSTDDADVAARNRIWLPTIERIQPAGAFIAVGAGHLGGHFGLLHMLSVGGYEVKRITSQIDFNRSR